MSTLVDALKALTFYYSQDPAFSGVFFPGEPDATEMTDLQEQFFEWPVMVIWPEGAVHRMRTHDSDYYLATYSVRIEIHHPREAGEGQNDAFTTLLPFWAAVPRVFFRGFFGSRFAGTVTQLGDAVAGSAASPLRAELRPDDWGGTPTLSLVHFATLTIQEDL